MKKKLLKIIIGCALVLSLTGCGASYQNATEQTNTPVANGHFTTIEEWDDGYCFHHEIVYANDTKVKYLIAWNKNGYGITPLYNADGTLQLYGEQEGRKGEKKNDDNQR